MFMIKIGYCTNMLAAQPGKPGTEWIPYIAAAGYDYVELPMRAMVHAGEEFIRETKKVLEEQQLPCLSSNDFLPPEVRITGDDVNRDRILAYLEKANKCMEILGMKTVVVGSAGARNIPEDFPVEKAQEQLVDFFRLLGETLPDGVTGVVEPICKLESNIINLVSEGLSIARRADRPNIRVLADSFHMENEKEPFSVLEEAGSWLRHVHTSPVDPRCLPFKEDAAQGLFIKKLMECGYTGCISIEAHAGQPEEELAEARKQVLKWMGTAM